MAKKTPSWGSYSMSYVSSLVVMHVQYSTYLRTYLPVQAEGGVRGRHGLLDHGAIARGMLVDPLHSFR